MDFISIFFGTNWDSVGYIIYIIKSRLPLIRKAAVYYGNSIAEFHLEFCRVMKICIELKQAFHKDLL